MTTTTLDVDPAIAQFATAVRGALLDLGPEEVDDLTEGLEADLIDQVADSGTESLGDPVAYAEELRAAAGLPVRVAAGNPVGAQFKANLHSLREFARNNRLLVAIGAFLLTLRPVWWVLRGLVIFGLFNIAEFGPMLPPDPGFGLVALVALVVVSVQWGRGRWIPWNWMKIAIVVVSAITVLAIPSVVQGTLQRIQSVYYEQTIVDAGLPTGLQLDGQPVSNIFAYGTDGQLLTNVRLYDQGGRPLSNVNGNFWYGDGQVLVPSEGFPGVDGWNVYPLETIDEGSFDPNTGFPYRWAVRHPASAPFDSIYAFGTEGG